MPTSAGLSEHQKKHDEEKTLEDFEDSGVGPAEIAEAIQAGMRVIITCLKGEDRSVAFAEILQDGNVPATFVDGGVRALYEEYSQPDQQDDLLKNIAQIPYFVILTRDTELTAEQRKMLQAIESQAGQTSGKVLRMSNLEVAQFFQKYQLENP